MFRKWYSLGLAVLFFLLNSCAQNAKNIVVDKNCTENTPASSHPLKILDDSDKA